MIRNEKYFKILGIPPTSDLNAIKKAYRKQALKYHPDRNQSADAHYLFIKITEAYEVLTGQRKIKVTGEGSFRPRSKEEIFAEKVAAAKERWRKQQIEEELKDREYFQHIAFGWKWRLFQLFAVYTACFSVLLSIDYYLEGEQISFSPNDQNVSLDFYGRTISVDGEHFIVENNEFWFRSQGQMPIRGNYSYLFHDLRSISIAIRGIPPIKRNSHSSSRMRGLTNFESKKLYSSVSFNSVYGAFPFLHIMFFVPLILVVFKRANLRFSVWRLVSIWIIYPTITFFTFSNNRIFYFIEMLFEG